MQALALLDAQIAGAADAGARASVHLIPTKVALAQLHDRAGRTEEAIELLREAAAVDGSVRAAYLDPLLERAGKA